MQSGPAKPLKNNSVVVQLPQSLINTISDIIDFYLNDRIDNQWAPNALSAKQAVNSFTQAISLGTAFYTIQPERLVFCKQLKKDLSSKDITSLCNVATKLGVEAESAYKQAHVGKYSVFFLLAHALRNIIVQTLKENFSDEYNFYVNSLKDDLKKLTENILDLRKRKQVVTKLMAQKHLLKLNLAYLEVDELIWKTIKHHQVFNQPLLLPDKADDDPSKPYFLQPQYGHDFINSAYQALLGCTLDAYIAKKEKEERRNSLN